ncbi:MAG: anaerobic ribonucleoside-triphosphate reductase activating protein [Bacteroidales bacterium]|nr:anaerobic ribonucleoside-triphosphate reductase activating protein [Bacteroidales bacterium]
MLKYVDSAVVFQEIPDEVTLAVNLSGCPCRCPGCHSKHLWADTGNELTDSEVDRLLQEHKGHVTCLALMGGDAAPAEVDGLFARLRERHKGMHTAWYSGRSLLAKEMDLNHLDYLKLGPYLAHLGPLKHRTTNQRLYRVRGGTLEDITAHFWRK